jgi:hypothetical protein
MITIQGIKIGNPADVEGLANLIDSIADPHCQPSHVAEKLFGLMVMLDAADDDDRNVIIERIRDFACIHTEQGREAIKAMSLAILDS